MNDPTIFSRHAPSSESPKVSPPQRMTCELLNAVQLAELLNISERTLYRLKSRGSLPTPILLGGSVRWRRAEILEWVACGCPPPSSVPSSLPGEDSA